MPNTAGAEVAVLPSLEVLPLMVAVLNLEPGAEAEGGLQIRGPQELFGPEGLEEPVFVTSLVEEQQADKLWAPLAARVRREEQEMFAEPGEAEEAQAPARLRVAMVGPEDFPVAGEAEAAEPRQERVELAGRVQPENAPS